MKPVVHWFSQNPFDEQVTETDKPFVSLADHQAALAQQASNPAYPESGSYSSIAGPPLRTMIAVRIMAGIAASGGYRHDFRNEHANAAVAGADALIAALNPKEGAHE